MTTSTAAKTPPRCLSTTTSFAITSQPLNELIVTKYGTSDIDSTRNTPLTVLRGIPTGNSLPPATATAVDRHFDDDDASHPPQPRPSLSPTEENNSSTSLLPSQSTIDDSFDYRSKLVEISNKIDQMKQRWPLRSSIDDGHPIIPGNTPFPHSGPFSPPNLPAHDEPFDYKAQLAANEAAIERMKQRWPLPLQPMAQALSEPPTPRDTSASSSSPRQPTSITSTTTMPSALRAMVPQPDPHHRPTVVPSPTSAAQPSAAAKDELNDPTLLDAATALDNFLIQYPRKLNLPANIPCYQPSPHGPSLCHHALLAQQTAVL